MTDPYKRHKEIIESARLDADPGELEGEELLESLVATARLVEMADMIDLTAAEGERRNADPEGFDWDESVLASLRETADENGEAFRGRLRELLASIELDDSGGSSGFRVDEELR